MFSLFKKAEAALEPLRTTNEQRYRTLLARVNLQKMTPLYLALSLHMNFFTKDQVASMIDEIETIAARSRVTTRSENVETMAQLIERMRIALKEKE